MFDFSPVVLLIEDDAAIRGFVSTALEAEGCIVHGVGTLERALIESGTRRPDAVVLDLGLPDGDGMNVIVSLRTWTDMPILVLSARVAESEKIAALDAGADDYLAKPFGVGELIARLRVLLRRRARQHADDGARVAFGDIVVDLAKRQVTRHGEPVHLTAIEYRLLALMLTRAGRVLTHREILREVWGPAHVDDSHYLRIYMGHLRQKLEADPAQPVFLLTEIGVGYRFIG
jgi:two-component system KDP operon response regulator KdpE